MSIEKLQLTDTSPLLTLKEEYDVKDENLLEYAVENGLLKKEEKDLIQDFLDGKEFTYIEKVKLSYIHLKQDIPGISVLFGEEGGKGKKEYLDLYISFIRG